jgi:hypothetical protein
MRRSVFILLFILTIVFSACNNFENTAKEFILDALSDTTYTVEIPQDIGGVLLCKVHYYDDFQSIDYDIEYFYDNKAINDSLILIGSGSYSGEKWNKNEQLIKVGEWNVLQTSNDHHSDKLLVGKLNNYSIWKEHIFSPETIEQNSLWKTKTINSSPDNYDSNVEIDQVTREGQILAVYEYAIRDRWFSFMTSERKLSFKLNIETGEPELLEIRKK